ncbi:proline dioxygenase [Hydrogenophaga crassostreae]|uniref:Proline dioxygenase n=1 Tax=Hydrogenophaga crassostreae TaxID=1763535 RepID=A0A162PB35_9BURK|nr:2OG-Fe(II) oxygenase [Hydrogenophaga crassostreae]AOW14587.1 proline dioxygenase [Hydrogenophaga crassostreae]OAD43315.1 proline dioxygenase [Hydrogenophaga crassostreae]
MTQVATPALREWIVSQTAAGFAPEQVLSAMVTAGWEQGLAETTLENTLRDHLRSHAKGAVAAAMRPEISAQLADKQSSGVAVPTIAMGNSPRVVDVGDRQVAILSSMASPRVVVLGGLLSDEECDALIAAARPRMARSLTVETKSGGEELNESRTSNGMFFSRGESELLKRIEARISRLLNWPVENGEGMQVLYYGVGAEYKPHYDYFDPNEPGTPTILKRGGQRVGTLVMYLNEPACGGGTIFPDVGLEVAPQRGNAVFFSYDKPDPTTRTLHGGAPVVEGEKWVATKWLRAGVFE